MQNKPNLLDNQMNASSVNTMNYEQLTMNNEPIKQTQTNPTCSELVESIANPGCFEINLDLSKLSLLDTSFKKFPFWL